MTRLPRLRLFPVLFVVLAALVVSAPAGANGDPASDYLLTLPVFFPFDPSEPSDAKQQEFTNLLNAAKDKGFEVRVALIANRRDLGAVPSLYRKPQTYADFLGQELVYYYKGPLLIVMPNGYGVFQTGKAMAEDKAVLAKLAPPGTTDGDKMVASAETAVRALAQRRGISIEATATAEQGSSTNRDRITIVAGVILLAAVAFGARLYLNNRGESHPA